MLLLYLIHCIIVVEYFTQKQYEKAYKKEHFIKLKLGLKKIRIKIRIILIIR